MPADIFGHVPSPSGTIMYWDDDPVNLPVGWVVCDGNNGTPNLLSDFLKEIPDSVTEPGTSGGQNSYTLSESQMPPHNHSGSVGTTGNHSHVVYGSSSGHGGGNNGARGPGGTNSGSTGTNGAHSHSVSVDNTGGNGTIDNKPSFIELVPIMRL